MNIKKYKIPYEGREIDLEIDLDPFSYEDKLIALIEKYGEEMDEFFFCARTKRGTIGYRKGQMHRTIADIYDYMIENSLVQKEL